MDPQFGQELNNWIILKNKREESTLISNVTTETGRTQNFDTVWSETI